MEQSLPTGFDNTSSVFNLMPMYAAMQVGQQNANAQNNTEALQQAFQNSEAQKAKMNPLDLAFREAQVQHEGATSDYTKALARSSNLGSDLKQGTLDSDIEQGNASNKAKTVGDQVAELENHGRMAGQAAAILENMGDSAPGWAKAQVVRKALGGHLPDDDPRIDMALSNDPNLVNRMRKLSEDSFAASSAAKTKAMEESAAQKRVETQGSSSIAVAKEATDRATKVAETNAAAKVAAIHEKAINDARNAATALRNQAAQEPDPAKKQELLQRAQYADQLAAYTQQLAAATAKAGTLDLSQVTNLPPSVAPPMPQNPQLAPPQPQGQPAPPAPQAPINPAKAEPTAQQKLTPAPAGRIRIFDPKTGQAHTVPQNQADEALKQGYVTF